MTIGHGVIRSFGLIVKGNAAHIAGKNQEEEQHKDQISCLRSPSWTMTAIS
jgi:hypothetical protein